MKLQITPIKRLDGPMVVWPEYTKDVDVVMDPRPPYGLKFRKGSINTLYAFDVIGMTNPSMVQEMLDSWMELLAPGGVMYIIEADFDYICRAYAGGDLTIFELNESFIKKTFCSGELLIEWLRKASKGQEEVKVWNKSGLKFPVNHYEIIYSATKLK